MQSVEPTLSRSLAPSGQGATADGQLVGAPPGGVGPGLIVAIVIWLFLLALGGMGLIDYTSRPGVQNRSQHAWPTESALTAPTDRPRLVLFAHPECPCTRASLANLERLGARCAGMLDIEILFVLPHPAPASWSNTALRRFAASITGALVRDDADGVESRRFGAQTSGHTVLYDPAEGLIFSGGITPSRGHEGSSDGSAAVIAWCIDRRRLHATSPVYGCALFNTAEWSPTALNSKCSPGGAARP